MPASLSAVALISTMTRIVSPTLALPSDSAMIPTFTLCVPNDGKALRRRTRDLTMACQTANLAQTGFSSDENPMGTERVGAYHG